MRLLGYTLLRNIIYFLLIKSQMLKLVQAPWAYDSSRHRDG
jgi:hypothetical protein